MGLYTRITRTWLEQRFARRSSAGVYLAHMPVYGYGTADSENNQVGRLARLLRILRELDGIHFQTLLDVGAAEGWLPHLARTLFGAEVAAADLSHEACRRAGELFGLPAAAVDSSRLPFADGAFDVVVCSEVIEHVEAPVETMLELLRVAKKAVVFTTEEIGYDRSAIDEVLFRRPGWPHMERNLFHPDDLASCFPGATFKSQCDVRAPRAGLDEAAARAWLFEHTRSSSMTPGHIGVVITHLREPAQKPRAHTDEQLLDALFAPSVAPGARWPTAPSPDALLPVLRDPYSGEPLRRSGDTLVTPSGRTWPLRSGVPDFVGADDVQPSRAELAQRLASEPQERREALLQLRDRLFLPECRNQDLFDLRDREQQRGFAPNEQLELRDQGPGFRWHATGPDPWVMTPCLQRPVRELLIEMRAHAPDLPVAAGTGQVFWKGPADVTFDESRCVSFRVPNDGRVHVHRVVLAGHPLLPDQVEWLRLDLIDGPCEVDLLSLRLS